MTQRILVTQGDITKVRLDQIDKVVLRPGEARLRLESFALTANNVTYAATGFIIGYWKFFPSGIKGEGIVPVWGVARVEESLSEDLAVGARLYGFFPMAEELIMVPEKKPEGAVIDRAPHRAELPAVYNRYAPVRQTTAQDDHLRALLQPLLATSYLLFDWLKDNDWFGAKQIVIGSASSKTGLGLCKFLAEADSRPYRIVGLTSASNRGFVEGLNACDSVLGYGDIETLDDVPTVYVDMSGNADVKIRLHTHLGDNVVHSAAVGTSHWDKFAQPQDLPGARPKFFFAPEQIRKRREEWGPGVIERQITEGWKRLAATASDWLDIVEHDGLAAAPDPYGRLALGNASPREGHVVVL